MEMNKKLGIYFIIYIQIEEINKLEKYAQLIILFGYGSYSSITEI